MGIGFQGLLLSILLFAERRERFNSIRILSILILAFSLEFFANAMVISDYGHLFRLKIFTYCFVLLYGPLFLMYLRKRFGQPLSNSYYLHFLPLTVQLALLVPFLFAGSATLDEVLSLYKSQYIITIFDVVGFTTAIVYSLLIWNEVKNIKVENELESNHSKWLNLIGLFFVLFVFAHNSYFLTYHVVGEVSGHNLPLSIVMALFIYSIGYLRFYQPELMGKSHLKKYSKTILAKSESVLKIRQLMNLIDEENIYLSKDVSLSNTAQKMDISTHHLSRLINENLNQTFTELMNKKRVENAKGLLLDPDLNNEKLIAIGYLSGFNSKTNFYTAFKKLTGVSPSEFRSLNKTQTSGNQ